MTVKVNANDQLASRIIGLLCALALFARSEIAGRPTWARADRITLCRSASRDRPAACLGRRGPSGRLHAHVLLESTTCPRLIQYDPGCNGGPQETGRGVTAPEVILLPKDASGFCFLAQPLYPCPLRHLAGDLAKALVALCRVSSVVGARTNLLATDFPIA